MSDRNATESRPHSAADHDAFNKFKSQLHQQLVAGLDLSRIGRVSNEELRKDLGQLAGELCQYSPILLSREEEERLVKEVLDEALGLGPLEPLLADPGITDILINGPRKIYIERNGQLELTNVAFTDERHLLHVIQRIVGRVGRRVDESSPMVDARLPDGSRVNAVIPPLALDGAMMSIRRFGAKPLEAEHLVAKGSLTREMLDFLAACVKGRLNIVISGGTGSGKTTLMNALSAYIPGDQRIITIEDAAELQLQQPHVGRLETRPQNIEGTGEVTTRELVRNALRMRPDRIVVGECRGAEVLDMLQAMNTGHEGSLTTIHANDTHDALGRLEMMVALSSFELPVWWIRRQIVAAVHLLVHIGRLPGGARKVTRISEIAGAKGEDIDMHDLFVFEQTGVDQQQRTLGHFTATGARPKCLTRLAARGLTFPPSMFEKRTLGQEAEPEANAT